MVKILLTFISIFLLVFVVSLLVTFAYNWLSAGQLILGWETAFQFGLGLAVSLTILKFWKKQGL